MIRQEMPDNCTVWDDGNRDFVRVTVWKGRVEPWDWSAFAQKAGKDVFYGRILAYRNPSTKSVDDLKAMISDPSKIKILEDA